MPGTKSWEMSTFIMRLLTGGDCTFEEITLETAQSAYPEAF
jgi:hypothetical protein